MHVRVGLLLAVLAVAPHALASGEPCATSMDCGELRCVESRCIDPANPPTVVTPHACIGLVWMGGPAIGGLLNRTLGWDTDLRGTFLFAVRGGVLIGGHELALEVSPGTYYYYRQAPGPAFQANATYGYLVPLITRPSLSVYWPLRIGAGLFTGNTGADVYFQARADVVGLAIRVGHFIVDLHAPSFRYAITVVQQQTPNLLSWEGGVGISYVF